VKISATIITFNEENNIAEAINSLSWADEIIVVDSESTDNTCLIAKDLGARVFVQKWLGFGKQKQFAVEKAAYDWVFSLDADERVSADLIEKIKAIKNLPPENLADAYKFSRLTYYMDKPINHSGWYPDWKIRLFNKNKAFWKDMLIHESIEMSENSNIEKIPKDIIHYSIESVQHHHRMIGERYAPLSAEQMYKDGRKTSVFKISTVGFFTFLKTYFLKGGFLDGFPGFCIARFASYHDFLKHLLLYEKQNQDN
jgi:glycosyltransferase involved in cell wall biosynthesis